MARLNFANSVVPDTVQNIEDKLQVLLSESNQQQQDLDQMLNDLSSLKTGYFLLQQENMEQDEHFQELLWINKKLLRQLDQMSNDLSSLKTGYALLQQENIEQDEHFQELLWINKKLLWQLERQQEKLNDIDANLQEKAKSLQKKLDDIDADLQEKAETQEEIEGRVHPCGGTGWRRAIFLNMTDPNEVCPGGFILLPNIPVRACGGRGNYTNVMAEFDVSEAYNKVCGRNLDQGFSDRQCQSFPRYARRISCGLCSWCWCWT